MGGDEKEKVWRGMKVRKRTEGEGGL